MKDIVNSITGSNMQEIITWLEEVLKEQKVKSEQFLFTELLVEEIFEQLKSKDGNRDDFSARIKIRKHFGDLSIEMSASGKNTLSLSIFDELSIEDEDYASLAILNAYKKQLRFYRKKNENIVVIKLVESEMKRTEKTISGLIIGFILGCLINQFAADQPAVIWIEDNILNSIQTMFLSALLLVAVPQIFFSILSGISNISSTASLGRIGGKLVVFSLLKLGFYVALGLLAGHLVGGISQIPLMMIKDESTVTNNNILRDIVVGIIPDNIILPFFTNNILQLLFVACLSGVVLSKAGGWATWAKDGIDFFNHFLSELMDMIMPFVPLAVMVSTTKLMMHTGISSILTYGKIIFASAMGLPFSILLSGLVVGVVCKLSPLVYIKKVLKFIPLPFTLSNSTACMPAVMSFCHDELGMDKKFTEFSIPLGMQLNMDGTGFYVAIVSMVLAHTFGVPVDMNFCISFFLVQFLMALTGMGLIAMPSVYLSFGIPNIAVAMVMGIESILDMFGTAQSVAGNILSSFFVFSREKSVDKNI